MKKILLLLFIFWFSGSCVEKDDWYFIRVRNNSSKTIRICGAYILPEIMLPEEQLTTYKAPPGESREIRGNAFNDKGLKRFKNGEKITLFIIDEQIYQTNPWDTIRKYNMVLKRYEMDSQDYAKLAQHNGKAYALVYP